MGSSRIEVLRWGAIATIMGDARESALPPAARHTKLRILVIEDQRIARGALRIILEHDGYAVRSTGDGNRAATMVSSFQPHVVIMDWRLPGLAGEQLYDEIRRRDPSVHIIVVSSSDEAFDSDVLVDARLRKPLDVPRLRAAVEAAAHGDDALCASYSDADDA